MFIEVQQICFSYVIIKLLHLIKCQKSGIRGIYLPSAGLMSKYRRLDLYQSTTDIYIHVLIQMFVCLTHTT